MQASQSSKHPVISSSCNQLQIVHLLCVVRKDLLNSVYGLYFFMMRMLLKYVQVPVLVLIICAGSTYLYSQMMSVLTRITDFT